MSGSRRQKYLLLPATNGHDLEEFGYEVTAAGGEIKWAQKMMNRLEGSNDYAQITTEIVLQEFEVSRLFSIDVEPTRTSTPPVPPPDPVLEEVLWRMRFSVLMTFRLLEIAAKRQRDEEKERQTKEK